MLCLGPQTSIRQVIETGVDQSKRHVNTLGGQLVPAKCMSSLVPACGGNEYLLLINELCEAFQKRNKTVQYLCVFMQFHLPCTLIIVHYEIFHRVYRR
jgi:hypothetical protein